MARQSVDGGILPKLQKFEGSLQEKALRNIFKSFRETDFKYDNQVIENCNILKGCSFTTANVTFKTYILDDLLKENPLPEAEAENIKIDISSLTLKQLFNFNLFDHICATGLKTIPEKYAPVFLVLLDFLLDIKKQEESIQKVRNSGRQSESNVVAVLAHHLFSQLVPDKQYVVYNRSVNIPGGCPCGCNGSIVKGNTTLGSTVTWHGHADILVNQSIPVSLFDVSKKSDEEYEDEDDDGEEPMKKKKKLISDSEDVKVCVEVKKNENSNSCNVLLQTDTVDRIVAETVTNAFAQVNTNNFLSGMLIPTIGCTADQLIIFMYDPINDILLQSSELVPLWRGSNLNNKSIIHLWIILNFPHFAISNLSDKYKLDKSEIHAHAKNKIEKYREIKYNQLMYFGDTASYEAKYSFIRDNHLRKEACPKNINSD